MLILQKFWNHIRETEGIDIFLYITFGLIAFMGVGLVVLVVWGLIEMLGIYAVLVPFGILIILLILYGVGKVLVDRFDLM